ncbi:alpha/beta hydrolase family protein [Mycolicibacillus trivialis]|uniref:Esterase n=1 Tax=Mycolicibacillus trivialis TaxID=1798 RepID=A0A1X2EKT8_9MYCO|nr:esterase [Mycolicibacillus trivialis]ORX03965.1 esterase [Mycolicibacillus trivialis]
MDTFEYRPDRFMDFFGEAGGPTVLLWHGKQTDARSAVRPLAAMIAGHGLAVAVPDWNSHADDGGRDDLLRSLDAARARTAEPDDLVLAGWSMGGAAAAGLATHATQSGVRFARVVCLAGAFVVADPITGTPPGLELPAGAEPTPFTLLHGVFDTVIPMEVSRQFAAALGGNGWPVELVELDADHGSIAGATYDPVADRYSAAEDHETLAVAAEVAALIAGVARG